MSSPFVRCVFLTLMVTLASVRPAPASCVGSACLDAILCYDAKASKPLNSIQHVRVADRFNDCLRDITAPTELCTPVGVDGQVVLNAGAPLARYRTELAVGAPPERLEADVKVTTVLGETFVDLRYGNKLLVAAATHKSRQPPPPDPARRSVGDLHCYDVAPHAGGVLPPGLHVTLKDPFTGKPKRYLGSG